MQDLYLMKLSEQIKRWWKHAALVGAVLALVCPLLPDAYRAPCDVLKTICTLGQP